MARSTGKRSQAWAATITAERESALHRVPSLNPDKFAQADRVLVPKSTVPALPRAVRETFTMLVEEREALLEMKRRAVRAGFELNKSDIARMGLAALRRLSNEEFSTLAHELKKLKPGKPSQNQNVV